MLGINVLTFVSLCHSGVINNCSNACTSLSTSVEKAPNVNNITASAQVMTMPAISQVLNKVDTSKTLMTNTGSSLKVPTGCHGDAFKAFIDLPKNDSSCSRVDVKKGLWFYCSVCNAEVKGRSDRPFTIGRWNEHIKPGSAHCQKLDKVDVIAEIRKKSKSGEVSTSMSSCN